MAWRSFYGAIVYIIAIVTLFFSGKVSADLSSFLGQFSIGVFGFFGTIIAAYIGASTYHDVKLRNNQQN
ncbi:MAG: hypothetical protein D6732_04515 [Methanobacteriota archaeon]|nr:MAG: hypothetical protein D6732_04515 [Euryarchaeota archaeon]